MSADFEVIGSGTVYLLQPFTDAGRAWVAENIPDATRQPGDAIPVEHGYIAAIVGGIRDDGLVVAS